MTLGSYGRGRKEKMPYQCYVTSQLKMAGIREKLFFCHHPDACAVEMLYHFLTASQAKIHVKTDLPLQSLTEQGNLTLWRRNYFFNFSTLCIKNVNNTGTKQVSIMKQTAF